MTSGSANRQPAVAVRHVPDMQYPMQPPFDPGQAYPEMPGTLVAHISNEVYDQVRLCFADLQMDKNRLGTKDWSPLSQLVEPGNTVVIKPNLVYDTPDESLQEYTTTHPAVIRPIIDYCWKAMKGEGCIKVGDAPAAETDFETVVERSGLKQMVEILRERGVNIELLDFRALKVKSENGIWVGEQKTDASSPQSTIVNLGAESYLAQRENQKNKLHGAGYDVKNTNRHHKGNVHEYSVSKEILQADVVISVPKFKTHRKAGITCCLKNLVGINTDKNYLTHFTMGSENMGGDEMPPIPSKNIWKVRLYNWFRVHFLGRFWKVLGGPGVRFLRFVRGKPKSPPPQNSGEDEPLQEKKEEDLAAWLHGRLSGQAVAAGAWPGNKTICRMILDLNRIFLCADKAGQLQQTQGRKVFYVVDAVAIGLGNGPTSPSKARGGAVAAGFNGYVTDTQILQLMGVDAQRVLLYEMAGKQEWLMRDGQGANLLNGAPQKDNDRIAVNFVVPDHWDYA